MNRRVVAGLATGLATALLWGSWAVFTRHGLVGAVDRWDMMFVRYLPSGLILLPVLLRRGGVSRAGVAGVTRFSGSKRRRKDDNDENFDLFYPPNRR